MPGRQFCVETEIRLYLLTVGGVFGCAHPFLIHIKGLVHDREALNINGHAHARAPGHFKDVPGQAKPGDIGGPMDIEFLGCFRGCPVQGRYGFNAGVQRVLGNQVFQVGIKDHGAAQGFGQNEVVSDLGTAVFPNFIRVHQAVDSQAEFGFSVVDAVAAGQYSPRLCDFVQSTGYDLVHDLRFQFLRGKRNQVEAGNGGSAHGVHVTDGIGSSDLAELKGVVHRRRDVVGGHDQGDFVRQFVDPGIVTGFHAHQQAGIFVRWQRQQHFVEPDRVDFSCSAAGFGQPC